VWSFRAECLEQVISDKWWVISCARRAIPLLRFTCHDHDSRSPFHLSQITVADYIESRRCSYHCLKMATKRDHYKNGGTSSVSSHFNLFVTADARSFGSCRRALAETVFLSCRAESNQ
jgi:hypothetical protein